MAEPSKIVIDVDSETGTSSQGQPNKTLKRKRASSASTLVSSNLTSEQKAAQIEALAKELERLFGYYREIMDQKPGFGFGANLGGNECNTLNGMVGLLMEESQLALSKLVEEIHEKLAKERLKDSENVTLAMVKSAVLFVGQRMSYGVPNVHADVLEDETQTFLWCWETRDLKLIPKYLRGVLKIRRICRKNIHERITAVSVMITALQKLESDQGYKVDLMKASEKLSKALEVAEIRSLVDSMLQKNDTEMADKEAKREQKMLIKELKKNKREVEKEKKKEKKQAEKELKQLQEEVEKDEKRRQKEESEMRRQLRKQQEEVEKEQRRREKEDAELKRRIAVQKQASIMDLFLKRSKSNSPCQNDEISTKATTSKLLSKPSELPEAVTLAMDCTLLSNDDIGFDDMRKLHLSLWNHLGHTIRSNGKQHWSIRRKPKTELFKELKLTANKELAQDDDFNVEKLVRGWGEQSSNDRSCATNLESSDAKKCKRRKQLLQFDKSHRPAFYGIWPKKRHACGFHLVAGRKLTVVLVACHVVGPRRPLRKDPELDYDVDSDEEWEEEDPGESLSDCDKDDEKQCLEEGCSKDDEEESEDGFFVPDGYLSENEGVQVDRMEIDLSVEEARSSSSCNGYLENEEFCKLLQQQKCLNYLIESALRKNQPLIILNIMHEKAPFLEAEDLISTSKLEKTCLEALSIRTFPGGLPLEISMVNTHAEDQDTCFLSGKTNSTQISSITTLQESDMPIIISTIQSCSQSINKVVESLQQKFPTVPKSQLRSRVREISNFVDNRWQVKKEILDEVGISISPVKGGGRMQSISKFFSKRCLPPTGKSMNPNETSPRTALKPGSVAEEHPLMYSHF